MLACTAPGWSIRNTRAFAGRATSGIAAAAAGTVPLPRQSPRCFSSTGTSSARVVSPTTTRVAPSGRTLARWKATRSSRSSAAIEASVPLPVNGIA